LLGLKGIAIVCHGASNAKALGSAIRMAATFIKNRAGEQILEELSANSDLAQFKRQATGSPMVTPLRPDAAAHDEDSPSGVLTVNG